MKRHLLRKHKDEEEVRVLKNAPRREQRALFGKLRVRGIHNFNQMKMQKANFTENSLMRERIPKLRDSIRHCTKCSKYISNRYFFHHKAVCKGAVPIHVLMLPVEEMHKDAAFSSEILLKFREGEVGDLCRSDNTIKLMGYRHYCLRRAEVSKRQEVRKTVMTEMRELAHIYLIYKKSHKESSSVNDMFKRDNLEVLLDAVDQRAKGESLTEKSGLKLLLNTVIQKTVKTLRGYYNSKKMDDDAAELDKFHQAYNFYVPERFATARHKTQVSALQNSRQPKALPNKDDMKKFRLYAVSEIDYLMNKENLDVSNYTWLRTLLVAVITMWNFRRGEEGSRITLQEWKDAENDVWIPNGEIQHVSDEAEKYLRGRYKLVYLHGKGEKRYVPCLIPNELHKPINTLLEMRMDFGISEENIFLFGTKGGNGHASGWQAVSEVGSKINVKITATQNRHYISTLYAGFEMSANDREIFFSHLGHEESINRQNYQCPHGLRELKVMGRILESLDQGKFHFIKFQLNLTNSIYLIIQPSK